MKLKDKDLYIWGAGKFGALTVLCCEQAGIEIRGFIDSNSLLHGKRRLGLQVFSPKEIIDSFQKGKTHIWLALNKFTIASKELKAKGLEEEVDFSISPYIEIKAPQYFGKQSFCPICGNYSFFKPFGIVPRKKARCEYCGSLERYRLLWLFLNMKCEIGQFDKNLKILHIAAEKCLSDKFEEIFRENYLTADLYNPSAKIKMDITDIKENDEVFDIIICNHVLEHVIDDRKAMREFYRVLKRGGWAILNVPVINGEKTYEDFSINTEEGRLKAFGQGDHVRAYGRDYIDRLREVGFKVSAIPAEEIATKEDLLLMNCDGDRGSDTIYYCEKPM